MEAGEKFVPVVQVSVTAASGRHQARPGPRIGRGDIITKHGGIVSDNPKYRLDRWTCLVMDDNDNLLFINDGPNKVSNSLSRVFCSQALYESAHEDPSCNQSVRLYTIHPCRLRGAGGSIGTDGTPIGLMAVALLMAFPIRAVLPAKHLARKKRLR